MIVLGTITALVSLVIAAPQNLSPNISSQFGLLKAKFCPRTSNVSTRVTGGDDWCTELAPWYGVLEIKEKSSKKGIVAKCGASLVGTKHLVTAAHCVWENDGISDVCSEDLTAEQCNKRTDCKDACFRVPADQLLVYLGVTKLDTIPKPQPLSVSKIILHPGWNLTSPDNDLLSGHDIAVLELAKPLELDIVNSQTNIWPVSLPDSSHRPLVKEGVRLEVNGHGRTGTNQSSNILQHGVLEVSSEADCRETWRIIGDQVCAVGRNEKEERVDSCGGDSGSGLVATHHDRKVLVGVVSFGQFPCENDPGYTAVYTNVLSHIGWIKEIVVSDSIPEPQTAITTLIMSAKKNVSSKLLTSVSVHTAPITGGSSSSVSFPDFPFPISDLIPLYRVGQAKAGFCGGRNEDTERYLTACYTLGPNSWIEDSISLSVIREFSASTKHQDGTVVLGGLVEGEETRSVEVLVGKTSVPGPNMTVARSLACAVSVGNSVIVTGGYLGLESLSSVEQCEIEAKVQVSAASVVTINSSHGQCKSVRSMIQVRFNHACLSIPTGDDYIVLVAGGETWNGYLDSVEEYSRSGNSWRTLSSLLKRSGAALVYSLGKPRLLGGYSEERGGPTDTIYSLNMETEEWEKDEATLELPTKKTYALSIVPSNLRIF